MASEILTITTEQALLYQSSRNEMAAKNRELPFKTGYRLERIDEKIDAELRVFSKKRGEKATELCDKDEQGQPIRLDNGNLRLSPQAVAEFAEFVSPLLEEPLALPGIKLLTLAEFGDLALTKQELTGLRPFVIDE